jgi:hypothetical protein
MVASHRPLALRVVFLRTLREAAVVSPKVVRAGIDEDPPGTGLHFLRFSTCMGYSCRSIDKMFPQP